MFRYSGGRRGGGSLAKSAVAAWGGYQVCLVSFLTQSKLALIGWLNLRFWPACEINREVWRLGSGTRRVEPWTLEQLEGWRWKGKILFLQSSSYLIRSGWNGTVTNSTMISHLTSSGRFQIQVEGDGLLCRNSSDCTWLDPELEVGLSHHQIHHILKTLFFQCVKILLLPSPNTSYFKNSFPSVWITLLSGFRTRNGSPRSPTCPPQCLTSMLQNQWETLSFKEGF